jgi:cytidylate kinase
MRHLSRPVTSPHFAIAIDGPAASGKSTIARELAKRLGLVMVNSGAMYRAVTWQVLRHHIDPHDSAAVVRLLGQLDIQCGDDGTTSTITIDGADPGDALRGPEVNANVSAIAAIPEVRARLVALQRDYLKRTNIVMEGRDIGSVVFPDTPYKIYVDAADSRRTTAPLIVAPGATVLDNSCHSVESALEATLAILKQQGLAIPD